MAKATNGAGRMVRMLLYVAVFLLAALALVAAMLLRENIGQRKQEAREHFFQVVALDEQTLDPAVWGRNFPLQYDSYRRTVDTERTRHGGSEAFGKLQADARWVTLFQGYAFGVDYREERGHAYMLSDQTTSRRVTEFAQVGACLHCHAAVLPAYRQVGRQAGVPEEKAQEQVMKGFELVCAMPYAQARELVAHPITCLDCHDPETMQLRVTRPAFLSGIKALAASDYPVEQYASIGRWRQNRQGDYDVNTLASRQEMRTFVCAQCHVEYYFKGPGKVLTYPWHNGLEVQQSEAYYDAAGFKDWTHALSKAPLVKAQHPEFELSSQGIHSRSGVACADCHMPYRRVGAVKVSDHHVRSPLLTVARSCQTCHPDSEAQLLTRAQRIQDKTAALMSRAEDAVLALIRDIAAAEQAAIAQEKLAVARNFHRKAFWRLDYVSAENSMGFHADQEAARILAEAIDYARLGQEALRSDVTAAPVPGR